MRSPHFSPGGPYRHPFESVQVPLASYLSDRRPYPFIGGDWRLSASFPAGARVRFVVHVREVLEIQVGVHLRGSNVGMSEQLLHGTQITAGFQEMAGKCVAQ